MGQTLSSPSTKKSSQSGGNVRFAFGLTEMQGWRISMEDSHAVVLDLDEGAEKSNAFFAVYDGHGGAPVAKFAGKNVHKRLVNEEAYQQKQYDTALKNAFLGTDVDFQADPTWGRDPSGCTAVAALVTHDNKIYVANAGDSRSVIGIKGEVKALSFDHKPTNEGEKSRIHKAGGYVEFGRVNGNLALSRALGDFEFKRNYTLTPEEQIITADPDVTCHEMSDEDEFIVMACDGIWDCLTSQQVVNIVRRKVAEGVELDEICELICELCLAPDTSSGAGIGCDNMTILIVAILNGKTKEEWCTWIAKRVEESYGYPTPPSLPTLYSAARLMAFRQRREARERAEQIRLSSETSPTSTLDGALSILASGALTNDPTSLMFDNQSQDDSDEDDSLDEEGDDRSSFFSETLGLGHPDSTPPNLKHFQAQLEELAKDLSQEDDNSMDTTDAHDSLKESPHGRSDDSPSLPPPVNGDLSIPEGVIAPARDGEALVNT